MNSDFIPGIYYFRVRFTELDGSITVEYPSATLLHTAQELKDYIFNMRKDALASKYTNISITYIFREDPDD